MRTSPRKQRFYLLEVPRANRVSRRILLNEIHVDDRLDLEISIKFPHCPKKLFVFRGTDLLLMGRIDPGEMSEDYVKKGEKSTSENKEVQVAIEFLPSKLVRNLHILQRFLTIF